MAKLIFDATQFEPEGLYGQIVIAEKLATEPPSPWNKPELLPVVNTATQGEFGGLHGEPLIMVGGEVVDKLPDPHVVDLEQVAANWKPDKKRTKLEQMKDRNLNPESRWGKRIGLIKEVEEKQKAWKESVAAAQETKRQMDEVSKANRLAYKDAKKRLEEFNRKF